ncbi:hypothetical protein ACFW9O_34665 [Streptomyces sp. NPDC059499]|uniref:hypothetical protein n=1 Tax=Streptomyces sp. NPDC059499 TaxID=3346852 RepID=UPI0036CC0734
MLQRVGHQLRTGHRDGLGGTSDDTDVGGPEPRDDLNTFEAAQSRGSTTDDLGHVRVLADMPGPGPVRHGGLLEEPQKLLVEVVSLEQPAGQTLRGAELVLQLVDLRLQTVRERLRVLVRASQGSPSSGVHTASFLEQTDGYVLEYGVQEETVVGTGKVLVQQAGNGMVRTDQIQCQSRQPRGDKVTYLVAEIRRMGFDLSGAGLSSFLFLRCGQRTPFGISHARFESVAGRLVFPAAPYVFLARACQQHDSDGQKDCHDAECYGGV